MKRLVLGCDPVGKSVLREEGGFMSTSGTSPVAISDELRRSLLDWNERMTVLVSTPERFSRTELLSVRRRLNDEGERLARRVEAEHDGQVRVRFLEE